METLFTGSRSPFSFTPSFNPGTHLEICANSTQNEIAYSSLNNTETLSDLLRYTNTILRQFTLLTAVCLPVSLLNLLRLSTCGCRRFQRSWRNGTQSLLLPGSIQRTLLLFLWQFLFRAFWKINLSHLPRYILLLESGWGRVRGGSLHVHASAWLPRWAHFGSDDVQRAETPDSRCGAAEVRRQPAHRKTTQGKYQQFFSHHHGNIIELF